jgi:D-mannonate dehydratase
LPEEELEKQERIERLKQIIRNVGAAGIPIFGYNLLI